MTEMFIYKCKKHGGYTAGPPLTLPGGRAINPPCPKCYKEHACGQNDEDMGKKLDYYRNQIKASGIPIRFMGVKLDSYKPQNEKAENVLAKLKKYVDGFQLRSEQDSSDAWFQPVFGPKSILFLGSNGTGKTHLASTIAQELLFSGRISSFKYYSAYDLSLMIKNSWFRESAKTEMQIIRELVDIDLMIIDEVGVQFGTETDMLLFFQIFNKRLSAEKPTIMISNKNANELKDLVGPRVVDRLRESLVFTFSWESYRGKKLNNIASGAVKRLPA